MKIESLDRIEFSINAGTWNPMDEDMVLLDLMHQYFTTKRGGGELVFQTFNLFLHLKNSFYKIFNQLIKRV